MKLHIGCGDRYIPGWFHVDSRGLRHVDLVCTVESMPTLADGCAEVVYACHVLEHFPRAKTVPVLREWARLLRPGGILRVAVPDFEALAHVYVGHTGMDPCDVPDGDLSLLLGPLYGRQDHALNFHYAGFDEPTLRRQLAEAGLVNARRYDWRETEHATVDDFSQSYLPHMAHYPGGKLVERSEDAQGVLLSLNMEATKP